MYETGTCCLLAGPTPIATTGMAPEVPEPSKTYCLHEMFRRKVQPVVFNINQIKNCYVFATVVHCRSVLSVVLNVSVCLNLYVFYYTCTHY